MDTASTAITLKDAAQLGISAIAPFVAAGGALWIASLQRREQVSCFITWGWHNEQELSLLGIHNRSGQSVAIIRVRYRSGLFWRKPVEGTALEYEDPTDLNFPYVVPPGEIKHIRLDASQCERLVQPLNFWRRIVGRALHRSRVVVEALSSAGNRYATSAEPVLPWDEQLPWARD